MPATNMTRSAAPDPVDRTERLLADYLVKTYRYLRVSMIGVVVTLAVSVLVERVEAGCWQTSLSGYYYTPVRAVFVGALCAVGVALIAIKGSSAWEDTWFNFAGMMAPGVAMLPTTVVGSCFSEPPAARPVVDGELASWVVAIVDNNTVSLLVAGFAGLVVAGALTWLNERRFSALWRDAAGRPRYGMLATFVLLVTIAGAYRRWGAFPEQAHGYAAVAMFAFLAFGMMANVGRRRGLGDHRLYMIAYGLIAVAMIGFGAVAWFTLDGSDYKVLIIEVVESALVMVFWVLQTIELWNEPTLDLAESRPLR